MAGSSSRDDDEAWARAARSALTGLPPLPPAIAAASSLGGAGGGLGGGIVSGGRCPPWLHPCFADLLGSYGAPAVAGAAAVPLDVPLRFLHSLLEALHAHCALPTGEHSAAVVEAIEALKNGAELAAYAPVGGSGDSPRRLLDFLSRLTEFLSRKDALGLPQEMPTLDRRAGTRLFPH